jgi:hypothetical protein
MKRFWHVAILSAALAIFANQRFCGEESALALPPALAGWKLRVAESCVKPVPVELLVLRGTAGARQLCRAEYDGEPAMKLTLYDMPDLPGATAFDAEQKFPAQPGKMGFFKGHYFGVVESPGADREALNRFVLAVETTIPGHNEFHR